MCYTSSSFCELKLSKCTLVWQPKWIVGRRTLVPDIYACRCESVQCHHEWTSLWRQWRELAISALMPTIFSALREYTELSSKLVLAIQLAAESSLKTWTDTNWHSDELYVRTATWNGQRFFQSLCHVLSWPPALDTERDMHNWYSASKLFDRCTE